MEGRGVVFGEVVALAFDGVNMQHHGAVDIADFNQYVDERTNVVTVHRADGQQPELLEPGVFRDQVLGDLAHAMVHFADHGATGKMSDYAFGGLFRFSVRRK